MTAATPIVTDFKPLLRRLLDEFGWSQDALAARLGVSQGTVSSILAGKTARVAYELGRTVELMLEAGERAPCPTCGRK